MSFSEQALMFRCGGDALLGIVSIPANPSDVGVVIVVGGPQYRVGSHRQFVHLARRLAGAGYTVLRFDYRGMGDSDGAHRTFEEVDEDLAAAGTALLSARPALRKLVLFGLCDGASAILLSVQALRSLPICGLCLVNPWVRSEASLARTTVKHYYVRRLGQASFWRKLLSGRVAAAALQDFARNARGATRSGGVAAATYQQRMAQGLGGFTGRVLLVLSGEDFTAREFTDHAARDATWQGLLERPNMESADIPDADHTLSGNAAARCLEEEVLRWLRGLPTSRSTEAAHLQEIVDGHE